MSLLRRLTITDQTAAQLTPISSPTFAFSIAAPPATVAPESSQITHTTQPRKAARKAARKAVPARLDILNSAVGMSTVHNLAA